jgi:hypothetical protein
MGSIQGCRGSGVGGSGFRGSGFKVLGSGFWVPAFAFQASADKQGSGLEGFGVSRSAGCRSGQLDRKINLGTSNVQSRQGVKHRINEFCLFSKKIEQAYFAKLATKAKSESSLRNTKVCLF